MSRRMSRRMSGGRYATILALLTLAPFVAPQRAGACTIDGQPTAYADGRRAVSAQAPPAGPTPATWSPFSFAGRFRVGVTVQFAEDRARLHRILPHHATDSAWRWDYGDGTHAVGWTPTHRYRRPGIYLVIVSAYYPAWRHYYAFDDVSITVVR